MERGVIHDTGNEKAIFRDKMRPTCQIRFTLYRFILQQFYQLNYENYNF